MAAEMTVTLGSELAGFGCGPERLLAAEDQDRLVRIARRALEAHVRGEPLPPLECRVDGDVIRGAFVSVHRGGELRGCLGRLDVTVPLAQLIAELAVAVSD